ncbi:glycerophosphodiester phosphodiesterase family protein [Vacuolonema iberomarrocanum]|uniref:glycerophosphodiester phosphodiesterase family protein n=1 Tax=Vacuolonema iberomarrocanum TaxID=3454632 RepID=UPI0019DFE15B|nr:glycerophosphodiester phosphodiesterase [filamentous cyanobacterium LEGE 07170]
MTNWILSKPIAHRGLHNDSDAPENSLKAFGYALEQGYPIELDLNLLSDGNLAVFHDKDLVRMTGAAGTIHEQDSETIKKLKLSNTEEYIPLLDEVLELVNGKVPILIEIKNEGEVGELEQTLLNKLSSYSGEYAIQSFNPLSISWFKQNAPHILRGQLSGDFRFEENLEWYKKILLRNLLMNWSSSPHFIAYDINALPSIPVIISRQIFRTPVIAWTIKSDQDKVKALKYADNIIFDHISP